MGWSRGVTVVFEAWWGGVGVLLLFSERGGVE